MLLDPSRTIKLAGVSESSEFQPDNCIAKIKNSSRTKKVKKKRESQRIQTIFIAAF